MQKFSAKLQKLLPEPSLFVMPDLFLHLKKDDEMSVLADTIKNHTNTCTLENYMYFCKIVMTIIVM